MEHYGRHDIDGELRAHTPKRTHTHWPPVDRQQVNFLVVPSVALPGGRGEGQGAGQAGRTCNANVLSR